MLDLIVDLLVDLRINKELRIGTMEMEPDIENMTLNEYLKYEDKKERRIRRDGFTAALAILVTRASQSRQHVDTSLVHIESLKSPTAKLFDDDSRRISIFSVYTKEYHSDVLANTTRIMRKTLLQDSISALLLFGDWRLERTATFSISTISE
ncbi:hypothetical protein Tco_1392968 [Tanacetum coccineum]